MKSLFSWVIIILLLAVGVFGIIYANQLNKKADLLNRATLANEALLKGNALGRQHKFQEAIAEFDKSIELAPEYYEPYYNRAHAYFQMRKFAEAAQDFDAALKLLPKDAARKEKCDLLYSRALNLTANKSYAAAIAGYREVIALDPTMELAINNLAMLLASCPDAKLRDAEQAIKLARQVCEMTSSLNPGFLDTLAAAYAADGQFTEAVKYEKQAIGLLKDAVAKGEYEKRLKLYEAKKPYVEKL